MIYTVTLSPALDYLVWLDHFETGELNRTKQTAFRAGGKGINVSVVLTRLGFQSICLGFTAGFVGNELIRMLDEEGIRHDFIQVKNGCTRINVKIKSDTESEINADGPRISEQELNKLKNQAAGLQKGDVLILSGNPPKSMPPDIYSLLIDSVSDHDVRIVVDTSGKNLLSALEKRPYLIKPNKADLEEVIGSKMDSTDHVLVSLGPDGALLAADDGHVYSCAVPAGKLIDSTGAGDSMVAGFMAKDAVHAGRDECLRFAVACGCASAYSYELLETEEANRLYEKTPDAVSLY